MIKRKEVPELQRLKNEYENLLTQLLNRGCWREIIDFSVQQAAVYLNTAGMLAYTKDENLDFAVQMLSHAAAVDNKDIKLYANLSWLLIKQNEPSIAAEVAKAGLIIEPNHACYYNLGIAYKDLNKLAQAAEALEGALALDPHDALTHTTLADVYLGLKRFEEGLVQDEWRFACHIKTFRQRFHAPDWDGEADLTGKRILIFNEQGCGDAICYARYLPFLKTTGAYVILEVQEELVKLLTISDLVDEVIPRKELSWQDPCVIDDYDYVKSLQSLVLVFDPKLENIPKDPYLKVNSSSVNDIIKDKKKVGIVWAGSHWHASDRTRSSFLRDWKVLEQENVDLYSLQKGKMERTWMLGRDLLREGTGDYEVVNLLEGSEVVFTDIGPDLNDYHDTAVALKQLDLLISVDTSVVHLAGALGVPTWLMLPYAHEWRWFLSWYDSVRIFHQQQPGSWQPLLAEMAALLAQNSS